MHERFRQLILCPEQVDMIFSREQLMGILLQIGLLGEPVNTDQNQRFFVGPNFLQHISFTGCAPAIEFQPTEPKQENQWLSFTFIQLPGPFEMPQWLADLQMAKPGCPHCSKRIIHSEKHLNQSQRSLTCPHCQYQGDVCEFQWREFGGCASSLLSIVNVYPKEAIPTTNLLNQLQTLTKIDWRYFYFNGPLL